MITKGKHAKTIPVEVPIFTRAAQLMIGVAIGVMLYLYFRHKDIPEDAPMVTYTIMMTAFAAIGYTGTQFLMKQPLFPPKDQLRPMDPMTITQTVLILGAAMITQILCQVVLSFATDELALYFVFAAVCEEVFFRVLILELLTKSARASGNTAGYVLPILLQAVGFTAIHQNYYGDWPMLTSVFLGGIILGIFYVWWRNATANIFAHFLLNFIAVLNMLNTILFVLLGVVIVGFIVSGALGKDSPKVTSKKNSPVGGKKT